MFQSIDYLRKGNNKQRLAYKAINELGIWNHLSEYNPILCGTLPIVIDIESSDLDIIMEINDIKMFEDRVSILYGNQAGFIIKKSIKRNLPTIKVNFYYQNFEFELFGQPQQTNAQNAYLHMIIEHWILNEYPNLRKEVLLLKKQGMKTEPAFCKVLGIEGDPYEKLIDFGKEKGIIS